MSRPLLLDIPHLSCPSFPAVFLSTINESIKHRRPKNNVPVSKITCNSTLLLRKDRNQDESIWGTKRKSCSDEMCLSDLSICVSLNKKILSNMRGQNENENSHCARSEHTFGSHTLKTSAVSCGTFGD